MWKCISRTVSGTLEKKHFRCNNVPTTKVTQDSKCLGYIFKFSPVVAEHFNRYYGFYRACCKRSWKERQRRDGKAKQDSCLNDLPYSWLEALRWSSVLVLGWYFCQPIPHGKIIPKPPSIETVHSKFHSREYVTLVQYFTDHLVTKSLNYVLPEVSATRLRHPLSDEASGGLDETSASTSKSLTQQQKLDNLEKAHHNVLGALDNWLGTECMQLGKHKEAVVHFNEAAGVDNPAAMFNLGICCELGLGTQQNFRRAAELYKKASELGHATAMYNLGVFYIHGWGGIEVDTDIARELFEAAASLGQADAKQALAFTKTKDLPQTGDLKSKQNNFKPVDEQLVSTPLVYRNYVKEFEPKTTDPTSLWLEILNISLKDFQTDDMPEHSKGGRLESIDSGVLDMSPKDELDYFV